MNREFLKGIDGLTDEAINKIMAEYGRDVSAMNEKVASITGERDSLKAERDKLKSESEASAGLAEQLASLRADFDRQQAEAKRATAERELSDRVKAAIAGKKFTSDFTRDAVADKLKAAAADEANKGKELADLLDELTAGKDGIYKPENELTPPMGDVKQVAQSKISDDQLRRYMGVLPKK